MHLDAVFNIDNTLIVEKDVEFTTKDTTKFKTEALYGMLFPGKTFQVVVFVGQRFQRRTLVVHAYNPETYEFTAGILKIDMGLYSDPTVREEFLAYSEGKNES